LNMETPLWYFSKALSHRQKVCRLYKAALRLCDSWFLPDVLECRYQKVMLRARFDYYKGEKDPVKKQQLLLDGLKELWTKRHPCPFTYTYDPYGCAYNREEPPPDSILDVDWEHPERDQYPHYFAKREQPVNNHSLSNGGLFKPVEQVLCISKIDFVNHVLECFTEILVFPNAPKQRVICLNCSNQCKIKRIYFNKGSNAYFEHNNFIETMNRDFVEMPNETLIKGLSELAEKMDPDTGVAELKVRIPPEVWHKVDSMKSIRVHIDFIVEKPTYGVRFIHNVDKNKVWKNYSHVYSWKHSNYESRAWFPCFDSPSKLCLWRLSITCDLNLTAVCSGNLQDVSINDSLTQKTYLYLMNSPTPACNIGFAVGNLDLYVHPEMNELSCFCLKNYLPDLKCTMEHLNRVFEFYEELLSLRYPHSSFKMVFVHDLPLDSVSYSTLALVDASFLFNEKVIDQQAVTREMIAVCVAQQFYGCFVVQGNWQERWFAEGLALYLSKMYVQRTFGQNEYMYQISKLLDEVIDYEKKHGGIVLLPRDESNEDRVSDSNSPFFNNPVHADILMKKAVLIFRLLEFKITKELFYQVLNKLLSVAMLASKEALKPSAWMNMCLTFDSFTRCVSNVCGMDLGTFFDQWVHQGGHAEFSVSYVFNRKRNVLELQITQNLNRPGLCHSKARRHRKRKIPIWTGDEIDMDLSAMDSESPVLWILVDPRLNTIRKVNIDQPDYSWHYQLRYERIIVAQLDALKGLPKMRTVHTQAALTEIIESSQCYYRVRCAACFALASMSSANTAVCNPHAVLVQLFRKLFCSQNYPTLAKPNNFTNFQLYYLKKALLLAISQLKTVHDTISTDVLQFVYHLSYYNTNSGNRYSDDAYRATIIKAIGNMVQPFAVLNSDALEFSIRHFVDQFAQHDAYKARHLLMKLFKEIIISLALDAKFPSYRDEITVAALHSLAEFQYWKLIDCDNRLWLSYLDFNRPPIVRRAAFEAFLRILIRENDSALFGQLIQLMANQEDSSFRRFVAVKLLKCLTFDEVSFPTLPNELCPTTDYVSLLLPLMYPFGQSSDLNLISCLVHFLVISRKPKTLSGIGLIVVGAVIQIKYSNYINFLGDTFLSTPILLIIVGCILSVLGFFGCCGAIRENYCMTMTFAVLLGVIFILELAAGIASYVLRNDVSMEVEEIIGEHAKIGMDNYNQTGADGVTLAWDALQTQFECCGTNNYTDWSYTKFEKIPTSCCRVQSPTCTSDLDVKWLSAISDVIYVDGCINRLKEWVVSNAAIVGGVGCGVAIVQSIGMLLTCYFASAAQYPSCSSSDYNYI
ncbi:Transcription initiation factor TFIID subunit 2, partial [Trichinella sp. T6]